MLKKYLPYVAGGLAVGVGIACVTSLYRHFIHEEWDDCPDEDDDWADAFVCFNDPEADESCEHKESEDKVSEHKKSGKKDGHASAEKTVPPFEMNQILHVVNTLVSDKDELDAFLRDAVSDFDGAGMEHLADPVVEKNGTEKPDPEKEPESDDSLFVRIGNLKISEDFDL